MKRHGDSRAADEGRGLRSVRPRQEPVSCHLCRTKKLKCNREQPCSNCQVRGVPCQRQSLGAIEQSQQEPAAENAAILARLQRLEELVLGRSSATTPSKGKTGITPQPAAITPQSTGEEAHEAEAKRLEAVGTLETSILSGLSDGLTFSIDATDQASVKRIALQETPSASNPAIGRARSIQLPPEPRALCLFDSYVEDMNPVQPVLHVPSTRSLINQLYKQISGQSPVLADHVALLLSILATAAYWWTPSVSHERASKSFNSVQDAAQASLIWMKAALDVQDHSHRTTPGSLESIQATIILSMQIYHLEGFSSRFRFLRGSALTMARDHGMHKIDCQSGRPRNFLRDEVKRRVWWHLVATEWMLALNGGPQEGTYFIHPKQMCVDYPQNAEDHEIAQEECRAYFPLWEPKPMAYSLQRIRLAEMCRSVVDSMPFATSNYGQLDYESVMSLDRRFEQFLEELPVFFRIDESSRRQCRDLDARHPYLPFQRYLINCGTYIRRCKLNQPFLVRGSMDVRYSPSRESCLRSARAVIEVRRLMEEDKKTTTTEHVVSCAIMHQVFLATIVLVMDLCFNRREEDKDDRKKKVLEACKMLEEAKERSSVARKFLESLTDVLRRHKVRLPKTETVSVPIRHGTATIGTRDGPQQEACPPEATDLEDIWEDYVELGQNFDWPDWDHIFADLDSHIAWNGH